MVESVLRTDGASYIQVAYRVLSPKLIDSEKKGKEIALARSIGIPGGADPTISSRQDKTRAVLLRINEQTPVPGKPYEYFLTIGYPPASLESDSASFLTRLYGSLPPGIRVESIQIPPALQKKKGPRFGIEGLRKRTGEPLKPLIVAVMEPSLGRTPAEISRQFQDLAAGGANIILDAETAGQTGGVPAEKRAALCRVAAEKARRVTGRTALYAVNLSGRPSEILTRARRLKRLGATAFHVNAVPLGIGLLEDLREIGLPIVAGTSLAQALNGKESGFRPDVLFGALFRFAGADLVLVPENGILNGPSTDTALEIAGTLTDRLHWTFARSLPAVRVRSAASLPQLLEEFGNDVAVCAGEAAHGHPAGPRAGVRAFAQAVDLAMRKRDFRTISADEAPELDTALRLNSIAAQEA